MTKLERILLTKTPLAFIVRRSKHWHLPGFEGVPLFDVLKFFRKQVKTVGISERASAISYNFIMALPPAFLFLFTIMPHLPFIGKKNIQTQLHILIIDIIPAKEYNENIIKFIDDFFRNPKFELISLGLLLALFFASNAIMGLMRSFNKNYIGFQKRKGLHTRWIAIKLTIYIFGLVLTCLLLLFTQGIVLKWMGIKNADLRSLIYYLRWIFIIFLVFYSIAFIYRYAPAVHKRWKINSPGTILATTLSILATLGFSYFVSHYGRYSVLYGAVGTIIMLMALIYINSLVLLIGFELNVSITSLKHIANEREAREAAALTTP